MSRPEIHPSDHDWLRRLARRMTASPATADDLVQDTCVTALNKPPPEGEMRPWLRAIMRNLARGEVRGGLRRWRREDSYGRSGPTALEPDPLLRYGVDRVRLGRCVDTLPEPFRATVISRFVDGLSCAEIARAEGVPAGTVRWRQSRALELLRAELERPIARRRRSLAWLPLLGLERVTALWRRPARLTGMAWRAAAMLGALLVVHVLLSRPGGDGASLTGSPGEVARAQPGGGATWLAAATAIAATGSPARSDHPAASRAADEDGARVPAAARGDDREEAGPSASLQARRDSYERALYDCRIEDGVLSCDRGAIDPRRAGGGTCAILDRSLAALARVRRRDPSVKHGIPAYLAAAELADAALAAALGCLIVRVDDDDREPAAAGPVSRLGAARPEPACTSHEGDDGSECTTCVGADGEATTACAPVECAETIGPDGRPCASCTGSEGRTWSECAPADAPGACRAEVREYGVVCARCPDQGDAPVGCSFAECWTDADGCLTCTDGWGRTARDCALGFDGPDGGMAGSGSGDVLRSTSVAWGHPAGTSFAVHYAGTASCWVGDCLDCRFANGSGHGQCPYDEDLDEHLRFGRPPDLPAPGTCVTEARASGVECTTCTREDLSASTMCRLPPASSCAAGDACASCSLVGGGRVSVCE